MSLRGMRMGLMGTPMDPDYGEDFGMDDADALSPMGTMAPQSPHAGGGPDVMGDIRRINRMIGRGNSVGGRHVGQSSIYASRFGRDSMGGGF